MHENVRFWLDTIRSPRQESEEIDKAIDIASDKIVDEKYTYASTFHTRDSFQKTQKVRDQLSILVKRLSQSKGGLTIPVPSTLGESHLVLANPEQYRHLLDIAVFSGSTRYVCWPVDLNHRNLLDRNPFRKTRTGAFPKFYFSEEEGKILVIHPEDIALNDAEIFILKYQRKAKYGFEADETYGGFGAGKQIIVAEHGTVYSGNEYSIGDLITIGGGITNITSGKVVYDFVNSELSVTLHEEITRRAAIEILRSTGQAEKVNLLIAEFRVG